MRFTELPSPELMAYCIAVGVGIALVAIVLALVFGETTEERQHRLAREADAEDEVRAHVRTVAHRLASHRPHR